MLPGTVYNFGPDAFEDPSETAPQNPTTRKGAIRVEMEQRLREAASEGVPCLIVRCGDFFGPHAANNWFSQGLVKPGRAVTSISYPGKPGVGHQWAYLPDVGDTIAALADRAAALGTYEVFNMEGHWDADGTRMIAAIKKAVGNSEHQSACVPLVARHPRLAVRDLVPRDAGDALSLARAHPHDQRQARLGVGRGAAHAARRSCAQHARRHRLPALKTEVICICPRAGGGRLTPPAASSPR